ASSARARRPAPDPPAARNPGARPAHEEDGMSDANTLEDLSAETAVGVVLGSQDATPLELWVAVRPGCDLQLDDLVAVESQDAENRAVRFYGVVDQVRKRHEGTHFDSDAFRVKEGKLPAEVSYA